MIKIQKKNLYACDFCEKDQDQVAHLVRGAGKECICNECIMGAHAIIFDLESKRAAIESTDKAVGEQTWK